MSRKIISCAVTLAMIFSVLCFPALGYGTTETEASSAAQTETAKAGSAAQAAEKTAVPKVAKTKGLKAKAVSSKTIKLTWKKTAGATGYEVYKYSKNKKKYVKVKTTKKRSYKSTKLRADTAYRYKVRAYVSKNGKKYYGSFSKSVKRKTQKSDGQKIVATARKKIGASYRSGGSGPNAFDCSGFVYWVYKNSNVKEKKKVARTSSAGLNTSLKKYKVGSSIKSVKKAKAGDIILFTRGGRYSHAAIYAGKGKIIHAANPRKGVVSQSVKQLHNSGTRVASIIRIVE
ncbi:NlpC/P60 family protein [bacterium 210820-DFI.6.37]|nr:NlpC/P60 family protein [bacterium 210820-DFI.6.37]